jgi:hypothetical protein
LSQVKKYDLTDAHLAAIFARENWLNRKRGKAIRIVGRWLDHCRTELERRTEHNPTPPADFRRAAKLSCNCPECLELSRFLGSRKRSTRRSALDHPSPWRFDHSRRKSKRPSLRRLALRGAFS